MTTACCITVKQNQPYTFHGNQGRLRIEEASFEQPHSTISKCNHLHVVHCKVGNQSPIVLCTLVTKLGCTTNLHVEFEESVNIVFSTTGYRTIHLVGYFKEPIKYLTYTHLQQLLKFLPIAPANACKTGTDQISGDDQSLEKLILSNLDTFLLELSSTVANTNKEPQKIDLVLQDENTNGFNNQIAAIANNEIAQPATVELETNMDIDETPKDTTTEFKKHNGNAQKNEVKGLDKNEVKINNTIGVISKYEVLQPAIIELKIGNVNMAMTDTEEYAPDSEDNWNNDVNENHTKMRKQKTKKSIEPEFYHGNIGYINLEELDRLNDKDLDALILRQNDTFQKMRCVLLDKGAKIRVTINLLEKEKERRKLQQLEQEVHECAKPIEADSSCLNGASVQCPRNMSVDKVGLVLSNDNKKVRDSSTCYLPEYRESLSEIPCSHDARLIKEQAVVIVDEEEKKITDTPHDGDKIAETLKEITIYYPSKDDPESVEISYSDMECLAGEALLTSTIMNFYIRYLQELVTVVDKERRDYHFFNTYFYKKLKEALSDKEAYFGKFRRWWKGVSIFQKAYVIIPIHESLHWSLVIICIHDKKDESGPIILHLDSMGLHNSSSIFNNVRSFIMEEWNHLKQEVSPCDVPIAEKICRADVKSIEVPQQKNKYDCGLFVLYFMERFIEEAPDRLKKKDLAAMFGKQWFQPEEASGLRGKILNKLMQEFTQIKSHAN